MDPASIIGLVAACSSLIKTCGSVVTTLHNVAEMYKDAELAILSMIEQCENIRLAWSSLEEWAGKHLHLMDNSELLLERFQRSVYSGELTMAQLEKDLIKARSKPGTFRRRINVAWNATVFNEHQNRLRDQSASLQLLLQVISLPRNEDRVEMMSIKEPVFRKADDSVLSIIPSRLSSRLSSRRVVADNDAASFISKTSIKSRLSIELRYIPFSFDNDLFTSYVYKRNYRLPSMTSSSRPLSILGKSNGRHAPPELPMGTIGKHSEAAESEFFKPPSWFIPLIIPYDFYSNDRPHTLPELNLEVVKNREAAGRYLDREQFDKVLECVQSVCDIIIFFLPGWPTDAEKLIAFFWHVWVEDNQFFYIAIQRIAYSAGEKWIREFRTVFLERCPQSCQDPDPEWPSLESAGRLFDQSRLLVSKSSFIPYALQLACAAGSCAVSNYLLSIGFRPDPTEPFHHPLLPARVNSNKPMVSLLLDLLNIPDNNDLFTTALISLFSCHVSYIIWFDSAGPRKLHLEEAVEIFIQNGANPKAIVLYLDKRVPLIHAIIYTLHINKHCTENHWKAFQALMKHDILRDQFGEVVWGFNYISPLTLATVLGEGSIVKILLRFGPNRFWWGPTSEFNRQRLVNLMVAEAAVDFISTWCIPPLNSGDKIRLKQIGFAVFPEEDGAALHLTSSESHQQWQRARISFAKLKASKVTIPSIYPQIDIVQIVSSQISKEVMTVLGKPIISEEPRHLLLGLEQDTNSAGQMIHAKPSGESIALYLCNRNFQQAYECTLNGMDLAIIFHRIFRVPLQILVDFLEFVGRCNPQYWKLVLKRMAYTTGSAWIEFLESCIPRPPTTGPQSPLSNNRTVGDSHGDYLAPSLWLEPLIAARFTDTIRKSSTSFEFATSLEMACAADDIQVVQHLLDCSNHHTSGMGRLLIIASINHSVRTVRLIILYKVSEEMATSALGALIKNLFATYDDLEPPVKKLDLSWPRSSNAVLEVAELLVKAGADTSIDILKDAIENWNGLLLDWNIRPKLRVFLKSVVSPAMDV